MNSLLVVEYRAVAWPKYAGGQCLLSKYQVAISVLLLGIINLKNHKNWKSQGGQLPPLPPRRLRPWNSIL